MLEIGITGAGSTPVGTLLLLTAKRPKSESGSMVQRFIVSIPLTTSIVSTLTVVTLFSKSIAFSL
jgi:hypothetical protein